MKRKEIITMFRIAKFSCVVGVLLLVGCATSTPNLYQWGNYQPQVYEYLKGDGKSYQEQIAVLEADIQKARAQSRALPPGMQAHLGTLYAQTGQYDKMAEYFQAEKRQFPESTQFMDFLLKTPKK
jgi:hypothetical protein